MKRLVGIKMKMMHFSGRREVQIMLGLSNGRDYIRRNYYDDQFNLFFTLLTLSRPGGGR